MRTMSYSESRRRYAEVLDSVVEDRVGVIITREGRESAVIMSLDELHSLQETAHLMRSPANARRLLKSIEELESGAGAQHDLIDPAVK